MSVIVWVYTLLLRLYPPRFRAEFEAEMQSVLAAEMAGAAKRGMAAVAGVCWRELRDAPVAIIREYWNERSLVMNTQSLERASWWGVLATLVAFPLAAIPRREELPQIVQFAAFYGLFGLTIVLLMIGVVKGLPVWSLPSAGLFLAVFTFWLGFQDLRKFTSWVVSTGPGKYFVWLYLPYHPISQIINSGSLWLTLLAVLITLTAAAAILPPLRSLYRRFRRDWTLLSFIVYGASPISLFLTFDEYKHEGLYAAASVLLLAVGAWLYLWSTFRWQRWLVLFTAFTMAMATVAAGKWLILPVQDWPGLQGKPIPEVRYWFEVLPTMVEWGWIMIVMAAPALLMLLPRPRQVSDSP